MGEAKRRGTQFVRITRALTHNFGVELAKAERRARRRERFYQVLIVAVSVVVAIVAVLFF